MPGQKSIVWSAENDAKMLRALLVYGIVTVDSNAAQKISAEMGPNVPPAAITSHIQLLRQRAKKQGLIPTTAYATTKKRVAPSSAIARGSYKKAKVDAEEDGEEIKLKQEKDIHSDAFTRPMTPPKTPSKGKLSKAGQSQSPSSRTEHSESPTPGYIEKRSSPRSRRSVNYRSLHQGYVPADQEMDESGELIFKEEKEASDEDSAVSDEEFKTTEEEEDADDEKMEI